MVYGSKIFFYQERSGLNGKSFHLVKFRTMFDKQSNSGQQLPDNDRLTTSGKILRFLSLDELPNLINIIKGDMVFVGPRPALYNQDDLMTLRVATGVDKLKPGITGWAQINGRDDISIEKKVQLGTITSSTGLISARIVVISRASVHEVVKRHLLKPHLFSKKC
jgi:lipopolysaccharide/colanic/teichoic acid biosynthesis glycosyltransferase